MQLAVTTRRSAEFSFDTNTSDILQTHDLAIGYGGKSSRVVSEHIDLTVRAGELICLIGPNGAGKTTLMRTLAGMQIPLHGQVMLMDDDVHRLPASLLAQRLSVVLTERVNPGLLSAYALVSLGRHPYTNWTGRLTAQDETIVQQSLEAVGAGSLAARLVGELSDGERQKVMIARALAQEPVLMILDEPTAFLDLPRRVEIMQLLRGLAHESGRAILLSTHDLDLALRMSDRIWLMPMLGALQIGAPEDLILSGAFEAAFHAEGVSFDPRTGAFRVNSQAHGYITVIGEGLPVLWTRRALERAGYAITSNGTPALARVEVEDGCWRLFIHGESSSEYESLYDLVQAVR
jgi:iron complex transport system ATP-binding protein